ncbi:hypothetical protein WJX74_009250 [Apatococcus lobatus]|uniref:Uncharacterized protein n=1 Tax=Apatococcus lobatus TaxID=904363 RepID=A0AAW1QA48_9CHLO
MISAEHKCDGADTGSQAKQRKLSFQSRPVHKGSITILEAVIELPEYRPCWALWSIIRGVFAGMFSQQTIAEPLFQCDCSGFSNIYPISGDYHLDALHLLWALKADAMIYCASKAQTNFEIKEGYRAQAPGFLYPSDLEWQPHFERLKISAEAYRSRNPDCLPMVLHPIASWNQHQLVDLVQQQMTDNE